MARSYFAMEKAIRIYKENSDTQYIDILFGSGAPAGTSGETADAPVGSQYNRTDTGGIYKKTASTNSATDWSELGDVTIDELVWRNEYVRAATNQSLSAGSTDPTSWSDNESLDDTDFTVGDFVLGDVDGVPALFEVTAISSPNITLAAAAQAIASGDTFVVQAYLPDSGASQELQAIVHVPVAGSPSVKIGDINWNFADGIRMAAGYTAVNGTISSADSVNSAIEKLDGNQQDLQTLSGVAQGSVNLGSWTAPVDLLFSATSTIKALFQRIGVLLMQLRGVQVTGITTAATVDEVLVDDVKAVKWLVQVFEDATPANIKAFEVFACHDGTASADAADVDDTVYANIKLGSNFNLTTSVDLNGTGASQTMRLRVASTSAGVTVTARRIEVVKSVL